MTTNNSIIFRAEYARWFKKNRTRIEEHGVQTLILGAWSI